MWGSLLVLGLLLSLHPLRLGVTLLVISRSRPMQNLFTYWLGSLAAGFLILIVPLFLLHFIPALASLTTVADPASNPTARYIGVGLGVFAILAAVLMMVRFTMRPRAHASVSQGRHRLGAARDGKTTQVLEADAPNPIARLLTAERDPELDGGSRTLRLVTRVRTAWESGAIWVSFVIGLAMGPSVDGVLVILAIIVASGAGIGLQISAAVTFIVAMLAVEEVILVSNMAAPTRTQAILRRLHDWAQAHRRKVLVAIFLVVGVSLVAQGFAGG